MVAVLVRVMSKLLDATWSFALPFAELDMCLASLRCCPVLQTMYASVVAYTSLCKGIQHIIVPRIVSTVLLS